MTAAWLRGTLRGVETRNAPLVVKLGGSLLTTGDWPGTVATLLASLPSPRLLVTGGGPLVDGLRSIDRARPLPPELVHHLAIECMGHTARMVATALDVPLTEDAGVAGASTAVLDCPAWLARDGRLDRLPVGWHVTSDSIAAVVAAEHDVSLLLVKSVPPPHDDIERLAACGWVDEWFRSASRPLAAIGWAAPA